MVVLVLAGIGVIVVRYHGWPVLGRFGGAFALMGLAVVLARRQRAAPPVVSFDRRRWAVLAHRQLRSGNKVPDVVRLVAIGPGPLTVDLSEANPRHKVLRAMFPAHQQQHLRRPLSGPDPDTPGPDPRAEVSEYLA